MTKTPNDLTVDRAKLGVEAEAFMRSTLGRYLLERAELDISQGYEKLFKVSPSDTTGNIEARMAIQVPMDFIKWIREVVESGKLAVDELHDEEASDY